MPAPEVSASEASFWWRSNDVVGTVLNKLMIVLILAPVTLVLYGYTALSFVVFCCLIPYGMLLRRLAVRAVRRTIAQQPERIPEFEEAGIIRLTS